METTPISDSGFNDVLTGAELFDLLSVSPFELGVPKSQESLSYIADFVNKYSDAIPRIRQALMRKPSDISALDYISRFVGLQNQRMELKTKLASLEQEITLYE